MLLDHAIDQADTPQSRLQRAQQSLALHQDHSALPDALVAWRARPGWPEAGLLLGRLYASLRDPAAAVELLEAVRRQQPGNPQLSRDLERARLDLEHPEIELGHPAQPPGGGGGGGGGGAAAAGEVSEALDGGVESAAEGSEGGEGGEGAARAAKAAKAEALKELASSLMRGAEMGRALACLAEAIALAPWLASLYTNRAHVLESLHRSEEALLDAQQAISLAPDWPKARLRAARSLMSLERHGEAVTALEVALRHAPGAPVLMEAVAEARLLLRMQQRDERALASTSPVGDTDLVGIPRGRCCVRTKAGEECVCPAYVQRHRSMKIQLDGR